MGAPRPSTLKKKKKKHIHFYPRPLLREREAQSRAQAAFAHQPHLRAPVPLGFRAGGTRDGHRKPQVRAQGDMGTGRPVLPREEPPWLPRSELSDTPPQVHIGPHQAGVNLVTSCRPTVGTWSLARAAHTSGHQVGAWACSPSADVSCPRRTGPGCLARAHSPHSGPIVPTPAPGSCPGPHRLWMQTRLLCWQLRRLPGTSAREASPSAMCLGARVPSWGQAGWPGPQPPKQGRAEAASSSACLPALPSPQLCLAPRKAFRSCWGCIPWTGPSFLLSPGLGRADSRAGWRGEAAAFAWAPEPSSVLAAPICLTLDTHLPWPLSTCPPRARGLPAQTQVVLTRGKDWRRPNPQK